MQTLFEIVEKYGLYGRYVHVYQEYDGATEKVYVDGVLMNDISEQSIKGESDE